MPSASISGYEQVVAARQLAHEHERRQRSVRDAAVKRPHRHQRERPRVDARVAEQHLRRAPERAAEQTADDQRRGEVAGAAPPTRWSATTRRSWPGQERQQRDARHPTGSQLAPLIATCTAP
jgi:hypothetical protein